MVGLRRLLGFIPFVPPVGAHPFDPTEMARDVVRLRHYYARSGFPKADVAYQAKYHAKSDVVNVTYRIAEGPRADGGHGHVRGRGRHAHGPGLAGPRLEAVHAHRARAREARRRGRAPRAGRQHRALVPGPRLSVRQRGHRRAGRQRGQPRRPHRPGGARPASQGACHPRDRQADGSRARGRAPAPGRARATGSMPRRSSRGASSSPRWTSCDLPPWTCRETRRTTPAWWSCSRVAENPEHLLKGEAGFISYGGTHHPGHVDRPKLARRPPHLQRRRHRADRRRRAGEPSAGALSAQPHRISTLRRRPAALGGRRSVRRVPQRPPGSELGRRLRGLAGVGPGAAPLGDPQLLDLAPARV